MGCRKITYHKEEAVSENWKIFVDGLEKSASGVKKRKKYYSGGFIMPNQNNLGAGTYRYGMNGMEQDAEVKGGGNSYTSYFRQYDPRLVRWMSNDPKPVAWESRYAAFRNNPIYYADPSGDFPKLGIGKFFKKIFGGKGKNFKKVKNGKEFGKLDLAKEGIQINEFVVDGGVGPPGFLDKIGTSLNNGWNVIDNFMKNSGFPEIPKGTATNDELMGNGSKGDFGGDELVTETGGGNAEQGGQALKTTDPSKVGLSDGNLVPGSGGGTRGKISMSKLGKDLRNLNGIEQHNSAHGQGDVKAIEENSTIQYEFDADGDVPGVKDGKTVFYVVSSGDTLFERGFVRNPWLDLGSGGPDSVKTAYKPFKRR